MTQVRVYSHDGHTLVYDTDDIEDISIRSTNDSQEVPRGSVMHRELTGFTHLDVHIDFKHGKRALWVRDEELAALDPDRAIGAIDD